MSLISDGIVKSAYSLNSTTPTKDVATLMFNSMVSSPSNIAVKDVRAGIILTNGELAGKSEAVAANMYKMGCRKGDTVCVYSPHSADCLVMTCATARIGAVTAAFDETLTIDELESLLLRVRPKVIYTTESLFDTLSAANKDLKFNLKLNCIVGESKSSSRYQIMETMLCPPTDSNMPSLNELNILATDPLMIVLTYGMTGPRKPVFLSHRCLQSKIAIFQDQRWSVARNKSVTFVHFSHLMGCFYGVINIAIQKPFYIVFPYDREIYLKTVYEEKIESVILPTIAIEDMCQHAKEVRKYLDPIQVIYFVGNRYNRLQVDFFRKTFPSIRFEHVYAITECGGYILKYPSVGDMRSNSVGVVLPSMELKIVDTLSGKLLGPNQPGEILCRSPSTMSGYVGDTEASKRIIDSDGFIHTRDVGYYDEDGYFYYIARVEDIIIYQNHQILPTELEDVLLGHPSVADACVVGKADDKYGQLPTAFVKVKPGMNVTSQELERLISDKVEHWKILRGGIKFIASFPSNVFGVVRRLQLRNELNKQ